VPVQPAELAVVEPRPVKAVALFKDRPCHPAQPGLRGAIHPVDDALAADKLHCDQVPSVPFKARAHAGVVCYFVEARFFAHRLSVRVNPPYLQGAGLVSNFCAEHEPDAALARHVRAVYNRPAAQRYRRYAERLHLGYAVPVFAF
jgi:hypothetical protein